MKLHDSLDHAVSDVSADLPALVVASRNQGLSIRRRRRSLAAVGSVAAATVLAVGAYVLAPGDGSPDHSTTEVATEPEAPLSGQTAPITGRGAVAALMAAVDEVADGTFDGLQGSERGPLGDSLAAVRLQPDADAGPAGLVLINIDRLRSPTGKTTYGCESYMSACAVRQLPNGDILRTYSDSDPGEWGPGYQRLVAEVLSPARRMRLILGAANTNPFESEKVRAAPVLSTEQLVAVATQPWWHPKRLPREYVEAGKQLTGYNDAAS